MSTIHTQIYFVEREISMPGMEDMDWQEIPIRVEYTWIKPYAASWDEPAGGGVDDIVAIYTTDGDSGELDDAEFDACLQWLHDHHED